MKPTADLVPLFIKQFELSRVSEGEVAAVLSEPRSRPSYVEAACIAAAYRGAMVLSLSVPGMGWNAPGIVYGMAMGVPAVTRPSPLLDAIRGALLGADFIVDLTSETILHTPLREELLQANKRLLTIIEPPDALERLFPTPEIKARVGAVRRRLEEAQTLHLTSSAGCDLSYELIPGSGIAQYGYSDEPGHWDHWPSALASSYPADGGVNGELVIAPGDIVFPFKRYVDRPITMHIEAGYVKAVDGGLEARLIQDFIDRWKEPDLYAVSHVGFGLHPNAQWSSLDFYAPDEALGMDARSMEGGFTFSTGPNRYVERWSEVHLDICMRETSVDLDGERVMGSGSFIGSFANEADVALG